MHLIDRLLSGTRLASRYSIWACGALMIASILYVAVEVLGRKLGLIRLTGATEVGGFMLAITSTWSFTWTLLNRANIRLDALYLRQGQKGRAIIDLIALIAIAIFIGFVTFYAIKVMQTSYRLNSQTISGVMIPRWIPQAMWVAGWIFMCWTLLILILRVTLAIAAGDYTSATDIAGIPSADEEARHEAASAAALLKRSLTPEAATHPHPAVSAPQPR